MAIDSGTLSKLVGPSVVDDDITLESIFLGATNKAVNRFIDNKIPEKNPPVSDAEKRVDSAVGEIKQNQNDARMAFFADNATAIGLGALGILIFLGLVIGARR